MPPIDPIDALLSNEPLDEWDELALLTAQARLRQSAKPCRICSQLVLWRNVQGRKTRYNLDWSLHSCPPAAIAADQERRHKALILKQELDADFERHLGASD